MVDVMSENPEKREPKKSENLENQKSENPEKTGNEPEREYETISYVNSFCSFYDFTIKIIK